MDNNIRIYTSLGDGKLVATLAYCGVYNDISNEMADILTPKLIDIETTELRLNQIEKLVKRWRRKANSPIPTDRAIGYDNCADELETIIDRRIRNVSP